MLVVAFAALAVSNVLIARARDEAREARDEARYDLYVSNMRLAMEHWESGNRREFEAILERHTPAPGEPDFRGWEWHYLKSITDMSLFTLMESARAVRAVAWSPDGEHLATGGADGKVRIFLVSTREGIDELQAGCEVTAVAWSPERPDGRYLAARCRGGATNVWNVDRHEKVLFLEPQGRNRGTALLAWSPDGRWLAVARGKEFGIWDTGSWEAVATQRNRGGLSSVAWSPDGQRFATGADRQVVAIWRTDTWEELRTLESRDWENTVAWSPGQELAVAPVDHSLQLWETETWTKLPGPGGLKHRGQILAVAWSPDGERLASGAGNGIVEVWERGGEQEPLILRGHSSRVWSVSWDPTGTRLASASRDGTVKVWDPSQAQGTVGFPGEVPATWSPDGRWLLMEGDGGRVEVVDVSTRKSLWSTDFEEADTVQAVAFSPDSRWVAVGANKCTYVWDWSRDVEVQRFPFQKGNVECAAWSPNGRFLATGHGYGYCVGIIWDVETGEQIQSLTAHRGGGLLGAIAWSPDGSRLATTSDDHELRVWDTRTWDVVHALRRHPSADAHDMTRHNAVAWSPDGERLASGSSEGTVTVWDAATGEVVLTLHGHSASVRGVAWSPDGRRLASGSADPAIKIWDAKTGEELLTLRGHRRVVDSLAWDRDGRRLLSASGTPWSVRIWDATCGYEQE